jgi:hypothetical protein
MIHLLEIRAIAFKLGISLATISRDAYKRFKNDDWDGFLLLPSTQLLSQPKNIA